MRAFFVFEIKMKLSRREDSMLWDSFWERERFLPHMRGKPRPFRQPLFVFHVLRAVEKDERWAFFLMSARAMRVLFPFVISLFLLLAWALFLPYLLLSARRLSTSVMFFEAATSFSFSRCAWVYIERAHAAAYRAMIFWWHIDMKAPTRGRDKSFILFLCCVFILRERQSKEVERKECPSDEHIWYMQPCLRATPQQSLRGIYEPLHYIWVLCLLITYMSFYQRYARHTYIFIAIMRAAKSFSVHFFTMSFIYILHDEFFSQLNTISFSSPPPLCCLLLFICRFSITLLLLFCFRPCLSRQFSIFQNMLLIGNAKHKLIVEIWPRPDCFHGFVRFIAHIVIFLLPRAFLHIYLLRHIEYSETTRTHACLILSFPTLLLDIRHTQRIDILTSLLLYISCLHDKETLFVYRHSFCAIVLRAWAALRSKAPRVGDITSFAARAAFFAKAFSRFFYAAIYFLNARAARCREESFNTPKLCRRDILRDASHDMMFLRFSGEEKRYFCRARFSRERRCNMRRVRLRGGSREHIYMPAESRRTADEMLR